MPADLSLNTYTPHRWAQVVSGETWAEYAVGLYNRVEAQTVRGPLIVWATKTGEGESLPPLHAPTPSPLEVQAARVNMRAHFLAFVQTARLSGRVGGVRWKTWGKAQAMRAGQALYDLGRAARWAQSWARICEKAWLDFAPIGDEYSTEALRVFFSQVLWEEEDPLLHLALTWFLLEAAARARLARRANRRVRPPLPRSSCLPRPLYARPCPPTAPLAPPVA